MGSSSQSTLVNTGVVPGPVAILPAARAGCHRRPQNRESIVSHVARQRLISPSDSPRTCTPWLDHRWRGITTVPCHQARPAARRPGSSSGGQRGRTAGSGAAGAGQEHSSGRSRVETAMPAGQPGTGGNAGSGANDVRAWGLLDRLEPPERSLHRRGRKNLWNRKPTTPAPINSSTISAPSSISIISSGIISSGRPDTARPGALR
jgi:hypothetical protein